MSIIKCVLPRSGYCISIVGSADGQLNAALGIADGVDVALGVPVLVGVTVRVCVLV